MSVGLDVRKERIRREMAARRRAVPADAAGRIAEAVARRVAALEEWASCRRLVLYYACAGELPTRPLLERARERGLPLLWPRVAGGALEFARCDRVESLAPGAFGVPAPPAGIPSESPGAGDLLVAPGLAFDAGGWRLGRGGGHYDRALPVRGAVVVGVGYDFQWVEEVPSGPGDRRVDVVVTEERTVRCTADAAGNATHG